MQTHIKSVIVFFIVLLTFSSFSSIEDTVKEKKFLVVLDAGHGGKDSGTRGTKRYKTYEKDIALDVTLALGKMLEDNMPNIEVKYTRDEDVYPTLKGRSVFARQKEADLFISIHCNAQPGTSGTAFGSETFVLGLHKNAANLEVAKRENASIFLEEDHENNYKDFNPDSPEAMIQLLLAQEEYLDNSIELASYIETEFQVTANRKSRGVKQAGFYVLAYTYMPSVLVELGFLTNKKEEDFLNSKKGKKIMTKSLYNAVIKYYEAREHVNVQDDIIEDTVDVTEDNSPDVIENNRTDIVFKVQIAASSNAVEPKASNFKGLKDITRTKKGELYKYLYGNTSKYDQAKKLKTQAEEKGYKRCFIVAYKNGEKIALQEALKSDSN